jgi:hypothetical protein
VPRTINLDVYDYDGCGIPEIAMGHNFETVPEGWNLSTLPCVQTPGSNSHLIATTATPRQQPHILYAVHRSTARWRHRKGGYNDPRAACVSNRGPARPWGPTKSSRTCPTDELCKPTR